MEWERVPDDAYEQLRAVGRRPGQRALSFYKAERLFWEKEDIVYLEITPETYIIGNGSCIYVIYNNAIIPLPTTGRGYIEKCIELLTPHRGVLIWQPVRRSLNASVKAPTKTKSTGKVGEFITGLKRVLLATTHAVVRYVLEKIHPRQRK